MVVIADDQSALGLGGIVGGRPSGSEMETTSVVLESAWFNPITIANTGRKLQINTDARYAFERGVDPDSTLSGAEIATRMILDLCGGEASHLVQAGPRLKMSPKQVFLPPVAGEVPWWCGCLSGGLHGNPPTPGLYRGRVWRQPDGHDPKLARGRGWRS